MGICKLLNHRICHEIQNKRIVPVSGEHHGFDFDFLIARGSDRFDTTVNAFQKVSSDWSMETKVTDTKSSSGGHR